MNEELKKIVELIAEGINVVHAVINKEGIFKLFALSDEVMALASLDVEKFKSQLSSLSPEGRAELDNLFKSKLVLSDKALEAKIESGELLVEECVDIVIDGVEVVKRAKSAIEKFQKLVS